MKAILIFCIALFCISLASAEAPKERERIEVQQASFTSPLAFQYIQQLTAAGCITWTGNPTGFMTVTVVDCECFEDPHSAASIKLRFIASRPNITVLSSC